MEVRTAAAPKCPKLFSTSGRLNHFVNLFSTPSPRLSLSLSTTAYQRSFYVPENPNAYCECIIRVDSHYILSFETQTWMDKIFDSATGPSSRSYHRGPQMGSVTKFWASSSAASVSIFSVVSDDIIHNMLRIDASTTAPLDGASFSGQQASAFNNGRRW